MRFIIGTILLSASLLSQAAFGQPTPATPPTPPAAVQTSLLKKANEAQAKEVARLQGKVAEYEKKCAGAGAATPVNQCDEAVKFLLASAKATQRRYPSAGALIQAAIKPMMDALSARLDALEQAIRQSGGGDTECQAAAQSLTSLGEGIANQLVGAVAELCRKATADKTVLAQEWIRSHAEGKATPSRVYIGKNMLLMETQLPAAQPAPYGAYDKEAEAQTALIKAQTEAAAAKQSQASSGWWRAGTWGAMPVAGFAIGYGAAGAANPEGDNGDGTFSHGAAAKGGLIGLGVGLAAAGLIELGVWAFSD